MKISIVIPVKPDGYVAALAAIRTAMLIPDSVEVFIAEGTSPSRQRNQAAFQATGDILYFLDDDSILSSDSLKRCADNFKDASVAVVGGPSLTPTDNTLIQRLFGMALTSVFGAGAVINRYRSSGMIRDTDQRELILCNLAFRRSVFLEMGGFDERLYPNEENELLDRMKAAGYRLLHDPCMSVYRDQRKTLKAFVLQMFSYGKGRAQQIKLSRNIAPISLTPLIFVLYLIALPFFSAYHIAFYPIIVYGLLNVVFTLRSIAEAKSALAACLLCIFPIMHCTNGCGLLYGFLFRKLRYDEATQVRITKVL